VANFLLLSEMETVQHSELKLNEGEFKVYDRQLRLWGVEAQKK
jgi:hypothetical protein